MDADNLELATGLISATYVRQGGDSIQQVCFLIAKWLDISSYMFFHSFYVVRDILGDIGRREV